MPYYQLNVIYDYVCLRFINNNEFCFYECAERRSTLSLAANTRSAETLFRWPTNARSAEALFRWPTNVRSETHLTSSSSEICLGSCALGY